MWLFLALINLSKCLLSTANVEVSAMDGPSSTKYLLPIVRGYANNEVVGLKEVLALGRQLGEDLNMPM